MQAIVSDRRIRVTKNIEPMASQEALTKTLVKIIYLLSSSAKKHLLTMSMGYIIV